MARMVQCARLGRELPGLPYKPFNNELGQRIHDSISMQAWQEWIEHSKRLVNEYRLDLTSDQGQKIWMSECQKYFFGEGSELPKEFVPKG